MRFVSTALWLLPAAIGSPLASRQASSSSDRLIIRAAPETSLQDLRSAVEGVISENSRSASDAEIQEFSVGGVDGLFLDDSSATPEALDALRQVARVDRNLPVTAFQGSEEGFTVQRNATWGLARTSNRFLPAVDYTYRGDTAGEGIVIYVVDTGVLSTHEEFGDRVTQGFNAFPAESIEDLNGHGTHVAASAAGATFGVAKNASIIGIKCLDRFGDGTVELLIQCNEFVVNHARENGNIGRAVVNYSLGASRPPGETEILDSTFRAVVEAGLVVVVGSGNSAQDTINFTPGGLEEVFTVGSSDRRDVWSFFSNFGSVVDMHAPGEDITSAWIRSNTDVVTISGTSMASPHVAGAAAYIMALEGLTEQSAVTARLIELSSKDFLNNLPAGTPNRLLYTGAQGEEGGNAEPGFRGPMTLGNASINAPLENCAGQRTLIGGRFFEGEFDMARCAQHCRETSDFEESQGRDTRCRFFNTYTVLRDGEPSGQECALYTQAWETSLATNVGQWQGTNYITISNSFSVTVQGSDGVPSCQNPSPFPPLPPPPPPGEPPAPPGPVDPEQVCVAQQDDTCFDRGERCAIITDDKQPVCWSNAFCITCTSTQDCLDQTGGELDFVCAFEPTGMYCPTSTMCIIRGSSP